MKTFVTIVLPVLVVVLLVLFFFYDGPLPWTKDPAICMCSVGGMAIPADPGEQQKFVDHIRSQEFIVTILKREPKYAALIPEAVNFWHPIVTVHGGARADVRNNNVKTNLDSSYQQLFLDLRMDIYAELDYVTGWWQIATEDLEMIRLGCAGLDAAKGQNPALDLAPPVKAALEKAKAPAVKAALERVLKAAEAGTSLEEACRARGEPAGAADEGSRQP